MMKNNTYMYTKNYDIDQLFYHTGTCIFTSISPLYHDKCIPICSNTQYTDWITTIKLKTDTQSI